MEPVDPRGPKEELLAEVDWVKVDALCRTGTNPSLPKRKIYKKIIQQLKIRQIEKNQFLTKKISSKWQDTKNSRKNGNYNLIFLEKNRQIEGIYHECHVSWWLLQKFEFVLDK